MKGINEPQHQHLLKALLQLEQLLSKDSDSYESFLQASEHRQELETMYRNYERLLNELSKQIIAYEILYSKVKVQFLGRKLKELKKEIAAEQPAFLMLQASIRLTYGT